MTFILYTVIQLICFPFVYMFSVAIELCNLSQRKRSHELLKSPFFFQKIKVKTPFYSLGKLKRVIRDWKVMNDSSATHSTNLQMVSCPWFRNIDSIESVYFFFISLMSHSSSFPTKWSHYDLKIASDLILIWFWQQNSHK